MSTVPRRWFFLVLLVIEAVFFPPSDPSFSKLFPSSSAGPDCREGQEEEEEEVHADNPDARSQLEGKNVCKQGVLLIPEGAHFVTCNWNCSAIQDEIRSISVTEPKTAANQNSTSQNSVSSERHGTPAASVLQSSDDGALFPASLESEVRAAPEQRVEQEDRRPVKFAHIVVGISGTSLLGFLSGYLGDQTGRFRGNYVKLCVGFLMAAFVSALSLTVIAAAECFLSPVRLQVIRILSWMTLAFVTCAALDVSILFLEGYAVVALIPAALVLGVGFLQEARKMVRIDISKQISC